MNKIGSITVPGFVPNNECDKVISDFLFFTVFKERNVIQFDDIDILYIYTLNGCSAITFDQVFRFSQFFFHWKGFVFPVVPIPNIVTI